MSSADLILMMGNLSKSLASVQTLITGFGYIVGIFFIFTALSKMKHAAEPSSQEKMFSAVAYFVGGVALIFLPSMVQVFSNTAFGSGNVLQYIQYNPYDIYRSMGLLIQTAGLIWFEYYLVSDKQALDNSANTAGGQGTSISNISISQINLKTSVRFSQI